MNMQIPNLLLFPQIKLNNNSGPYLNNLCLWIDANDPHANGIQPAPGSLSHWTDKSGLLNGFTQITSLFEPLYVDNVLNGLPGVYFSNGPTYMQGRDNNFPTGSDGSTIFIVCKPTNQEAITNQYLFSYGTVAMAQMYGIEIFSRNIYLDTNNIFCGSTNASLNDNSSYIINLNYENGSNISSTVISLNNSNLLTTNSPGILNVTSTGNSYLSSYPVAGNAVFIGYILEIIFYNVSLNLTQSMQTYNYLKKKWGF